MMTIQEYIDNVEANLKGYKYISTGLCPGCDECYSAFGNGNPKDFVDCVENGELVNEASFSHSPCGICGSHLGGDRFIWHWVDDDGHIVHEDDCCVDCLMYIANGDLPDHLEE